MSRPLPIHCLALCAAAMFCGPRLEAREYVEKRERGILVIYPPRHETQANATLKVLLDARADIAARLGLPPDTSASALLVPSQEEFDKIVGPKTHLRLLGVAYSPVGRIVINLSQLTPDGTNNLYETLAHEMVHIMLGRYERDHGVKLPKWLHEGVASWLGRVLPPEPNDTRLHTAANQGTLRPLYHFDKRFPEYRLDSEIAYLQSEDFIRFLTNRHGPDAVARLLRSLAEHGTMRTAMPDAFGVDLIDEEQVWMKGLIDEHPFFWTLRQHFSLFSAAAILTIISFVLYRRRRARILAGWEEDRPPQTAPEDPLDEEPPTPS